MTTLAYQQIAIRIREQVLPAALPGSGSLPTEAQLCETFGVSRSTVRRALEELRAEGLVVSRQGSGWSAVPALPPTQVGVTVQAGHADDEATSALIHRGIHVPTDSVVADLGMAAPDPVLLIERVSIVDGVVVHRSETWFAPQVSASVDPEAAESTPPAQLLRDAGHRIGAIEQFATATISNRRDEALIGVPAGSAILQVTRIVRNEDGQPLFQSLHRHPGGSTRIAIELPTTNEPDGAQVTITPQQP